MNDIFKSIKAYLYDRTSSPLIGAFIVAWAVWNYRLALIVFGGKECSVEDVFNQIDNLYESVHLSVAGHALSLSGELLHGVIIPAIITLSYLYVYPWLSKPVYEHSLRKQKELREIKQLSENNRLLSVEESREIYRRLAEMKSKHNADVDYYEKQVASLNETIQNLEKEMSTERRQTDRLRQSGFVFINDADIEEFDSHIENNLSSIGHGEFQLSDLFDEEQWRSLSPTLKQSIGKRFKMKVERGDFVGVRVERKGTGNQQIYSKSLP